MGRGDDRGNRQKETWELQDERDSRRKEITSITTELRNVQRTGGIEQPGTGDLGRPGQEEVGNQRLEDVGNQGLEDVGNPVRGAVVNLGSGAVANRVVDEDSPYTQVPETFKNVVAAVKPQITCDHLFCSLLLSYTPSRF